MAKVPKEFHDVFWEINAEELDTDQYPEYIMERILEYGTLEGVNWVRRTLGDARIKRFIASNKGRRRLSTRTLNFWQIILNLKPEECIPISLLKTRSPFWNY